MDFFIAFYIFILAAIAAYGISSRVPKALRASFLTTTSFINSIVLIGAIIVLGSAENTLQTVIGFFAVALAAANAMGSFMALQLTNQKNDKANDNNKGDK